jgi:hypothetical protein
LSRDSLCCLPQKFESQGNRARLPQPFIDSFPAARLASPPHLAGG